MEWVGHILFMIQIRNAYKILVKISEAKRPFGRPRHRWEDNNITGLKQGVEISTGFIW
jgi:hypothetical protein